MFNYSFWADEAYISGIALQWIAGKLSLLSAISITGASYQKLQLLITGIFFKLFGISEFTARLPSLIAFIFGIIVIFFLAKKLSNVFGGILSLFLYTFSHLNLSYATQAKPYSLLETITLLVLLLLVHLTVEKDIKRIRFYHIGVLCLLFFATLLHTIGVLLWIIYFVFLISQFKLKLNIPLVVSLIIIVSLISFIVFPFLTLKLFPYNFSYQVVKLFTYKYSFILISAVAGYVLIFKKNKVVSAGILLYAVAVLILATFQQYIFNIRYVLTLFGILFLYFGIFWAKVGEKYAERFNVGTFKRFNVDAKAIIPLAVLILIYATGYKIVRFPQAYYNPNTDKYGDVQIANYKDFYAELKQRFPQYMKLYMLNDIPDAEYWYLGRNSNDYLVKFLTKPTPHYNVKGAIMYGSVKDLKTLMKIHPQGLLIMEDWQSFLPDDIKDYAKKYLRLEFRIESLNEAQDDPWPLALYSWGFKENPKP